MEKCGALRRTPKHNMTRSPHLIICIALGTGVALAGAAAGAPVRGELDVVFEAGSIPGPDWPVSIDVPFPRLLRELGATGRVDRYSIQLSMGGSYSASGMLESGLVSDIFHPAHTYTPAAFDTVAWVVPDPSRTRFTITFRTVHERPARPWGGVQFRFGAGEPLVCASGRIDAAWYALMAWGDLDGDGRTDLVAGGYNEIGHLNYFRNLGKDGPPLLSMPERLVSGHDFINRLHYTNPQTPQSMGMGIPQLVDADEDGDLDLYIRYNDWYTDDRLYFENRGTPQQHDFRPAAIPDSFDPEQHKPLEITADWTGDGHVNERISVDDRFLLYHEPADAVGKPIAALTQLITCIAPLDMDEDGLLDVVIGRFDGTLFTCRNLGEDRGRRLFARHRLLTGYFVPLSAGSFSTPEVVDWDGDGDPDLLCGNEEGAVIHFDNPGNSYFRWTERGYVNADGAPILFSGDIREPNGQHWGYTTLTALDWDDDEDIDLLVTERLGKTHLFSNRGTRTHPRLTHAGHLVHEDGRPMVPHPRVKPGFHDWNGDGHPDVIMTSTNGVSCFYAHAGRENDRVYKEPLVLTNHAGEPVYRERYRGQGRTRFVPIDWNTDGKRDFLVVNHAADGWPRYFENVGTKTEPRFAEGDEPRVDGQPLWMQVGHAPCPAAWDWNNDGREDLVVGGENGLVYYYDRRFFDPHPVIESAKLRRTGTMEDGIDVTRLLNVNRSAAGTVRRDDFEQATGADRWIWKTGVPGHMGNVLAIEDATGDEVLVYDPEIKGVCDVFVGFMVQKKPARVAIRRSGDRDWDPIGTTVYLEEYKTSPDIAQPKHHFQAVHWTTTDMTGRTIEIRPEPGAVVNLDCLQFTPRESTRPRRKRGADSSPTLQKM